MGMFDTQSDIKDGQNLTEKAVKVLSDKGILDPRVYDPNIQFRGTTTPMKSMEYATAYVDKASPGIVNLVKPSYKTLWANPMDSNTIAHEVEHSLAHTGGAELNQNRNRGDVLLDNYAMLRNKKIDKTDKEYYTPLGAFFDRASNKDIGAYLKKNYGVDTFYLGARGADSMMLPAHYEELASDLGAAMKNSKKDVFADPFLQQKLFNNDPYLMEAVRSTLHVEPRMDAKDPQRMTAYPQNVDRYKKLIEKRMKEGGSVPMPDNYSDGNWKLI
jgi:hypothetical protein